MSIKVQVMLNESLVAKIDDYAKAIGMSRSALCGYFIGQGMFGLDKGIEIASGYAKTVLEENVMENEFREDEKGPVD